MKALSKSAVFVTLVMLAACVTINVYFPAAAAEQAADRIIRDVYGAPPEPAAVPEPAPQSAPQPSSQWEGGPALKQPLGIALLNRLIPIAYAGADISLETPAIQAVKGAMTNRHRDLATFYDSGAIGMTGAGLITIRDLNSVPLPDRHRVQQLVADENRDRNVLYTEIARANGHPEWEEEIRGTFARRWIDNAPAGWWHQDGADWKQKK